MNTNDEKPREPIHGEVLARMEENRAKARLDQEMLEWKLRPDGKGDPFTFPLIEYTLTKALMMKEAGLHQQGEPDELLLGKDALDRAVNADVAGRHWEVGEIIVKAQKDQRESDG